MPNSFTTVSGVSFMCLSLSILKRVIETVPPDFSPRLPYLSKCKKILKNKEDRIKIYYRYFLYTHINCFAKYSYSFRIRCKLQSLSHSSRIERKHFNDKERILYGKGKTYPSTAVRVTESILPTQPLPEWQESFWQKMVIP